MNKCLIAGFGVVLASVVAVSFSRADDGGNGQAVTSEAAAQSRPATAPAASTRSRGPDWRSMTVTQIQTAIAVSKELADKSEQPQTEELKQAISELRLMEGSWGESARWEPVKADARFPRKSHIAEYNDARPWRGRKPSVPRLEYGPFLRELLSDTGSEVRAMAAEALAMLHQPEDVALLGAMLGDEAAAVPFLSHCRNGRSTIPDEKVTRVVDASGLQVYAVWREETVAQCVQRALLSMTGVKFETRDEFDTWWEANRGGRNCLWYWQRRIQRECDRDEVPEVNWRPEDTYDRFVSRRRAVSDAVQAEASRTVTAEIRQLDPETEAKVRLLVEMPTYLHGSSRFWMDPPDLRVPTELLLDLLDRKNVWPDITWDERHYNLLVDQLGRWAHVLFTAEDAPRLLAAAEREGREEKNYNAKQGALVVGVSRLLPAAAAGHLNDVNTRDGVLRQAIRDNAYKPGIRQDCAQELVRVGLPQNGPFLKEAAFGAEAGTPPLGFRYIFFALTEPPLTPTKRAFLVDLLLDERFGPYWTCPDQVGGVHGYSMPRRHAFQVINIYEGRPLSERLTIDWSPYEKRLVEPATPADRANALAEIRDMVERLRE